MRYVYISAPNDKKYLLFHRALVSEENGKVSLDYYLSGLKRQFTVTFKSQFTVTFKSKDGILLNINRFNDNIVDYNMFIPETNPYFNMNVLGDAFPYLDKYQPSVMKAVKNNVYKTFKGVFREYKVSSE